jgi:glycosyltransferase involved in cell wall biosynthesis
MKIAILMPRATQRGGAENLLDVLLQYAHTLPLECIVIFLEHGPLVTKFRSYGIDVDVVRAGRLREVGQALVTINALVQLIKEQQFDVVFSWMSKAHLYGGWAAWLAGVPAAWYQHDIPSSPGAMDHLITLTPARKVLACSEQAAKAQRHFWPKRMTEIVYPCVDLSRFDPVILPSPSTIRQELGLPSDGPIVGIVGRLQRWKGIHVFVEAMARLIGSHPEAHGVIVGGQHDLEPEYADFIERRIDNLDLNDTVTLAGYQSSVPLWMQAMDVVVHASDHEPFGIVVIEAMALGKPVVAGDSGGPREIITEETDGLSAPYGDAEKLAQQIRRYLDAPDFADSVGKAARNRALEFSPERYAQRFVQALREVVPNDAMTPSGSPSMTGH